MVEMMGRERKLCNCAGQQLALLLLELLA